MANANSADIGIRVFLEDAASAGLFAISSSLGRVGVIAQKSSLLFGGMSQQLVQLGIVAGVAGSFALFAGALVYATQQGAGLYAALTQVGLATGLDGEQLAALQPYLLNLGGDSIYSLQELADGMVVLGQYGYKTTQQLELMSTAGKNLAEVTGSTTVDAFKLLAVTMQAFNLPASQADNVAALLFYSIEHGTPNVGVLTTTLGSLGGVATQLHVSLQDLIPALDTVSIGLGSASTAGAGLRYFLTNIIHPTAAAAAEMEKIGFSAFDVNGKFLGLKPTLQEVSDAVQGLSDSAKADILGPLFNVRSGAAIKQLLQQIQEYEQGINNVSDAQKLQNQMDAAVALVMNNIGAVTKEVVSNFQDFAAEIGQQVLPTVLGFMTSVLVPLATHIRQMAADPAFSQAIAQFLLLGAAISGVGLIIIGTFMSPILAFVAIMVSVMGIIAGVALGIMQLRAHWASLQPVLTTVVTDLRNLGMILLAVGGFMLGLKVTALTGAFIQLIPQIVAAASTFFTVMIPALVADTINTLRNIGAKIAIAAIMASTLIPTLLASAGAWLISAAASLIALGPYLLIGALIAGAVVGLVLLIAHLGFLNTILGLAKAVWAALLPSIQQAGDAIRTTFLQALKQLQPVWAQLQSAFIQAEPALTWLGRALGLILVVAIGLLIGIIRGVINVFVALLTMAIHIVTGIIQIFSGIITFFSGFFTFLHGIFTHNTGEISAGWNTMGQGLLTIIKGIWNAVSAVFIGAFNAIKGFVTGFIQGIIGFFQNLANTLIHHSIIPDMLEAIWNAFVAIGPRILGAVGGWIGGLLGHFKSLPGQILSTLGNLGSLLLSAGQALVNGFLQGIKNAWGAITNFVAGGLNAVRNLFPHSPAKEGPLMDAHLWMPNLVHMLADTAEKAGPSLKASMGRVAQGARAGLGTAGGGGGQGSAGEAYTLNVDGKAFMTFFHNQLTGQLQANGVGRLLK